MAADDGLTERPAQEQAAREQSAQEQAARELSERERELARRLRDAHRRVKSCAVPDDERARLFRRLIAITDAAKHDIPSASDRLDAFLAALDDTPTS